MDAQQAAAYSRMTGALLTQGEALKKIAESLEAIERHLRAINERAATAPR